MKYFLSLFFLFSFISCNSSEKYPWLYTLDPGGGHKESGKRLMSLDAGLHPLENPSGNEEVLLIGVHGGRSEGFEWIYPLQTIDNDKTITFFYRWNDGACTSPAARNLLNYISSLINENINLELVVIVGHSYGGVLVSSLVEKWDEALPIEIHSVASPLAGFDAKCNYQPPVVIAKKVSFYEWRTQHELDGAFKSLKIDPQVINLEGSKVTLLPDTYRGRRLGHNWSISWVADRLDQLHSVE